MAAREFRLGVDKEQLCGAGAFLHVEFMTASMPVDTRRVVLKMDDVDSLDSRGIATLVRMHSRLARRGCGLMLSDVRHGVADTLDTIGLTSLIPVEGRERRQARARIGAERYST